MTARPSYAPLRPQARQRQVDPYARRLTRWGVDNPNGEFILYWAQSARRLEQNLSLDYAIEQGNAAGLPVVVYESLRPDYPGANDRLHTFVLESVAEKVRTAERRGLRYGFFLPRTTEEARGMVRQLAGRARLLVTDEYPTFVLRAQTERLRSSSSIPLLLVDGNGMLPMRAFEKEQYSAKVLRDRAHRLFEHYWTRLLDPAPRLPPWKGELPFDTWDGSEPSAAAASCAIDHGIAPVASVGSREEGLRRLDDFIANRLDGYAAGRRSPDGGSALSPYLHFGLVGIHEVANRVLLSDGPRIDVDDFLEEAIIRRELSFNLCFFRPDHDSLSALPDWARITLNAHRGDRRKPSYSLAELEQGATHDDVWNLSQRALVESGTIHNYLRMLWGKKIMEWSDTPEEAHRVMLDLHERYAIDGRDPNTHAGILWCFGKHDRPWGERPIFGSVRYMSSEATRRKVDLEAYAAQLDAEKEAASRKRWS